MQRKIDKRNVYNAGKGKANQELIHLHMSNHYRRILNAKKAVDNSPPYCFKLRRPSSNTKPIVSKDKVAPPFENLPLTDRSLSTNSNKESCWGVESHTGSRYHVYCVPEPPTHKPNVKQPYNGMDLVDRIAFDTKNGPAAYCDEGWMEVKAQHNDKRYEVAFDIKPNPSDTKPTPSAKRRLPNTTESTQKRKFAIQSKNENAVSAQITLEVPTCKCTKICVCDSNETVLKKNPKEQSVTSSRDSAYNGGVSSLPESRSPTPDQRRKKECCCCCCEKRQREGKLFDSSKLGSRVSSPRLPPRSSAPPTPKHKNQQQEAFKKMQEDALYVKFIQDITTEILEKNLYTNKALKKVMKKHIKSNIKRLHKDRMLKEVENLRIQLGIPEDKTLLEFEIDADGVPSDVYKFYPTISDSEFVMPNNADGKPGTMGSPTSGKMARSISAVMAASRDVEKTISGSETDNGEVISTIQVMKSVRERRKDKTGEKERIINRQNSSDDSDRPSNPKKRSVLKNRKQKFVRSYSFSSSDSERSGNYSVKIRANDVPGPKDYLGEFVHKSSYMDKKNRNVSFWKNPDLNVFEIKHKKTVTRSKESVLQDVARAKHKND